MNDIKPLILIVEDNEVIAKLLEKLFKRKGYRTSVAYTVEQAWASIEKNMPDLCVLDVELPDGDGFSLCSALQDKHSEEAISCLFLTGRTLTADKVDGLNAGGDYYLTKPYDNNELIAVVQRLLSRREQMRKKVANVSEIKEGPLKINIDKKKAYIEGRDAGLTSKEFELLVYLVRNKNKDLTAEKIYENVWNTPMNHNTGTVRTHIYNLRKKLREEDTDEFAILFENRKGYMFTTD